MFSVPLEEGFHLSWMNVSDFWNGYIWLIDTELENKNLTEENANLRAEVVRLRELSQQAQALREILNLRTQTGYEGVVTSVIGSDPSGWVESVIVDKGMVDGVVEKRPAVVGGAVVGQVYSSSLHSANVLLLTDRASGVAALVQRTRARGIVLGTGRDDCRMDYVGAEEDVLVGDIVVTSGLDGVYPKGLEIGQVIQVDDARGGMFKQIRVRPTVDLEHLETLFILTEFGS